MKLKTPDLSTIKGTKTMIKYARNEILEWERFIIKAEKELEKLKKGKN